MENLIADVASILARIGRCKKAQRLQIRSEPEAGEQATFDTGSIDGIPNSCAL